MTCLRFLNWNSSRNLSDQTFHLSVYLDLNKTVAACVAAKFVLCVRIDKLLFFTFAGVFCPMGLYTSLPFTTIGTTIQMKEFTSVSLCLTAWGHWFPKRQCSKWQVKNLFNLALQKDTFNDNKKCSWTKTIYLTFFI